ncbi:MAG: hypothetical protein LBF58_03215, partial [Deltaproteobacteria bacterium]|nr:hypothetical protein [Deltaproteobacteria bacterium]
IPGRVHSFESLKGHLTISFLATVISSLINNLLKGSKFCSADVFSILRELDIDIYENTKIVRVPVRTEKDIISLLQLKCPFEIETSKLKSSYLNSLGKRRKVGRPRGNENKPKEVIQASDSGRHPLDSSSEINPKKRGRPPKPRSTTPSVGTSDTVRNYTPKTRGRKKGYENKPKEAVQVKDDKNNS